MLTGNISRAGKSDKVVQLNTSASYDVTNQYRIIVNIDCAVVCSFCVCVAFMKLRHKVSCFSLPDTSVDSAIELA